MYPERPFEQLQKGFADILMSMKPVKPELIQDTKDVAVEKINDQVDPSVQREVDENVWEPLEEVLNPIFEAPEVPDEVIKINLVQKITNRLRTFAL